MSILFRSNPLRPSRFVRRLAIMFLFLGLSLATGWLALAAAEASDNENVRVRKIDKLNQNGR